MSYDVIVIGSGIGGLTTAGLLARAAGKRVLVLERHTEPGGLTHTFRRDGASWDVGVHYIGQVGPGSRARAYFDYLSGGELGWNRMPDAYDRFVYPGLDLSVSSDPDRYERELVAAFPQEAKAIHRYFKDIRRTTSWTTMGFIEGMVPRPMASLLRLAQRLGGRTVTGTTKAYLDTHVRSPELKAVLASQWGDYGLPPSRSAFAVHAMVVSHYLEGGWFPQGGSARIARTFEKGVEQAGGAVRVAQEVTEILLDDGAASGVRVMDHRGPLSRERVYRAPVIVSAVGASNTFNHLLPASGDIGRLTGPARRTLANLGTGTSAVTVFLRLRDDPRSIGLDGGNICLPTKRGADLLRHRGACGRILQAVRLLPLRGDERRQRFHGCFIALNACQLGMQRLQHLAVGFVLDALRQIGSLNGSALQNPFNRCAICCTA